MGLTKPRAYQIYDIDYKQATRVATITNTTLSGGAPNVVDGVTLTLNDRVLVAGQGTGSENGLYYVTTVGSGSNGTWSRSVDGDQQGEINAGLIVMVTEGTIYADTQWKLTTNDPIVIGVTPLTFVFNALNVYFTSISAGGNVLTASGNASVVNFAAGSGMSITGNTVSNTITFTSTGSGGGTSISNGTSNVNVVSSGGNVTVGVSGVGNVVVWAPTGEYVTGVVSASGNVTGGNLIATGYVQSANGLESTSTYPGPYGDGIVVDYLTGTGRISVGSGDGLAVYNGGIASTLMATFSSGGQFSAVGNVVGSNFTTTGLISASGNITSGNISSGNVSATNHIGTNVSVTGVVTAASTVGGVITGTSTSVTGIQTAASTVGGVITGSSTSVTGTQTAASTVGGVITGSSTSVTGTQTAASTVGGVITGSSTSVTGAVSGASASVSGAVTAASTVGGIITGSSASVTGIVTGSSHVGSVVSVTGAITGASVVGGVITGSSVSVSGNVTGGNVNTNALVGTGVTITSTGALSLAPTANISVNSRWINSLADPSQAQDAATKNYVDSVTANAHYHASANAASTSDLTAMFTGATVVYNNGTAGVGANLVMSGNTYTTIDGVNIAVASNRILIKNEANAAWNGIYTYSNSTVITRTTTEDNAAEWAGGDTFFVLGGTVNGNTNWVQTNTVTTMGTSNITFVQIGGGSSAYSAGTGLSLTGTQFNALTDGVTTAVNGSNQIAVKASATLTTPNIGAATGTSLSTTGTVTGGNLATGGTASATGTVTGGNLATGGTISATGNATVGNISATNHTGTTVSVTGTVTAASTVGGVITGSSSSVTGSQTAASTVGGVITGTSTSVSGGVTAASVVGGVMTGTSLSATANITGGNLLTGGNISATGNLTIGSGTGGNLSGANVISANVISANTFIASANITSGNILTGGLISATSTITSAANITAAAYYGPLANTTSNININNAAGNAAVSIGGTANVAVFSNTGAYLTLASANGLAGVTALKLTAGTFATAPQAGSMNYDGTAFRMTAATGNESVTMNSYFYRTAANVALANVATAQSWLGAGVTVQSNVVYQFNGLFNLVTTGTTSHTEAIGFGGTATLINIGYLSIRGNANAITATTGNVYSVYHTSNASTVQTGAFTTAQNVYYQLSGTVSSNVTGTFIPQLTFSAAPGGTSTVVTGAYFQLTPLQAGSGNVNIGTWA